MAYFINGVEVSEAAYKAWIASDKKGGGGATPTPTTTPTNDSTSDSQTDTQTGSGAASAATPTPTDDSTPESQADAQTEPEASLTPEESEALAMAQKLGFERAQAEIDKLVEQDPFYALFTWDVSVNTTIGYQTINDLDDIAPEYRPGLAELEWEKYNSYAGVPADYRDDLLLREMEENSESGAEPTEPTAEDIIGGKTAAKYYAENGEMSQGVIDAYIDVYVDNAIDQIGTIEGDQNMSAEELALLTSALRGETSMEWEAINALLENVISTNETPYHDHYNSFSDIPESDPYCAIFTSCMADETGNRAGYTRDPIDPNSVEANFPFIPTQKSGDKMVSRYYSPTGRYHTFDEIGGENGFVPHKGDSIFFKVGNKDWGHTGIVEAYDPINNILYTIEANSKDMVRRVTYDLNTINDDDNKKYNITAFGDNGGSKLGEIPENAPPIEEYESDEEVETN